MKLAAAKGNFVHLKFQMFLLEKPADYLSARGAKKVSTWKCQSVLKQSEYCKGFTWFTAAVWICFSIFKLSDVACGYKMNVNFTCSILNILLH